MAVGFPTKANWAAGDVLTASAQDDLAGTVNLLSNASAASGSQLVSNVAGTSFAYQATPSASNPVLNSGFNVWQRGTSISQATNGYGYTADRWQVWAQGLNNACTVSRQATSDTTNLPFIQYCARVQRNSGQTGTTGVFFEQCFETVNSLPFSGKSVTMSFYARAGANFSATGNAMTVYLITGTGTDQNQFSAFTGQALPINSTATLTTTWQRFTFTGTVASTATQIAVDFGFTPTGTAGTNDYFEITGVQIDIGSVALPFRTYAATYQGELAACQRYYYRITGDSAYGHMGMGIAIGTTTAKMDIQAPVTMRTTPTSVDYSTLATYDTTTVAAVTALTIDSTQANARVQDVLATASAATMIAFRTYFLMANNSASGYIGFSAEL